MVIFENRRNPGKYFLLWFCGGEKNIFLKILIKSEGESEGIWFGVVFIFIFIFFYPPLSRVCVCARIRVYAII